VVLSAAELDAICRIANDSHGYSGSSTGKSVAELLAAANYSTLRPLLTAGDLAAYLRQHPAYVDHWLWFSEDKRSSDCWYFQQAPRGWVIGCLESHRYPSRPQRAGEEWLQDATGPEACAEYILRELDCTTEILSLTSKARR
jgi:hypothetical protein